MVILIAGGTHTGKTLFAQKLLNKYHYPYLSLDHLKMGLIRSAYCSLTPESSDTAMTQYLWPIVSEIIKTTIENRQNLIIEGIYIPFDYASYFDEQYLQNINYVCLIFSQSYINENYLNIIKHACQIEQRLQQDVPSQQFLLEQNQNNLVQVKTYGLDYVLIDGSYKISWEPLL